MSDGNIGKVGVAWIKANSPSAQGDGIERIGLFMRDRLYEHGSKHVDLSVVHLPYRSNESGFIVDRQAYYKITAIGE